MDELNGNMRRLGEERSVIREIFEYGNRRKAEIGEENVFDFSLGNPNVPPPPEVNDGIARLIADMPPVKLHGYTSAAGAPEVREAVAAYLQKQFGAPVSASRVYMTCGAAASLAIALRALCNAGDEVVLVAPYFPEYRVFLGQAGAKAVEARAAEDFHLDLAALDRAIGKKTKALILNSPNNPTGAVYGEEELRALAELLRAKSAARGAPVYLIADEPYRELTYGAFVPFLPDLYADTVLCYSFSKSLSLAGERIGYIALPDTMSAADAVFSAVCGAGRALGYVCAPALFQRVAARCLGKSGEIAAYRKNRDLLWGALTACGFTCAPPDGAFYLFVKSPEADAKAFCERAKKYELLLVPSDSFGVGGYVRISYCVAEETIRRALPAFARLAEEYGLARGQREGRS